MACSQASEPEKSILGFYFNSTDSSSSVTLPKELKEISGLAMTQDGRLFAHNDENSVIYQIDYRNGTILKSFVVGKKKSKKEDFEGLAIVENTFFMVTSEGILFEFKEGEDGKNVKHKTHKTWLSSKYDVEGLCYDSETHALLLACKGYAGKGYSDERAVYVFSLNTKKLEKEPRLLLPKKVFKEDHAYYYQRRSLKKILVLFIRWVIFSCYPFANLHLPGSSAILRQELLLLYRQKVVLLLKYLEKEKFWAEWCFLQRDTNNPKASHLHQIITC
jgi:hypothetical protein